MKGPFSIAAVNGPVDLEAVRDLFRAYADELGVDLGFQDFETELCSLPGCYAPPSGALLLAKNGTGSAIGCIGLRPFQPGATCEMKRLYVVPNQRAAGVGAALVTAVISAAREAGYRTMLLDTLPSMARAQRLYEQHGFAECPPYYATPLSGTRFMKLELPTKIEHGGWASSSRLADPEL